MPVRGASPVPPTPPAARRPAGRAAQPVRTQPDEDPNRPHASRSRRLSSGPLTEAGVTLRDQRRDRPGPDLLYGPRVPVRILEAEERAAVRLGGHHQIAGLHAGSASSWRAAAPSETTSCRALMDPDGIWFCDGRSPINDRAARAPGCQLSHMHVLVCGCQSDDCHRAESPRLAGRQPVDSDQPRTAPRATSSTRRQDGGVTDEDRYLRRRKNRRRRAAARRLTPIRGEAARRLRTRGRAVRLVGLGSFAQGMARRSASPKSRVASWSLAAVPVVVLVVWVVARLTRHL